MSSKSNEWWVSVSGAVTVMVLVWTGMLAASTAAATDLVRTVEEPGSHWTVVTWDVSQDGASTGWALMTDSKWLGKSGQPSSWSVENRAGFIDFSSKESGAYLRQALIGIFFVSLVWPPRPHRRFVEHNPIPVHPAVIHGPQSAVADNGRLVE